MIPHEVPLPLLVYLDQNAWIELAKIQDKTVKSSMEQKLLDKINLSVINGQVVFPLSIVHFDETGRNAKEEKRKQLAELMAKLSDGYAISPSVTSHIAVEVQQIILTNLGYPEINMRPIFIKKGISHLLNSKGKLVSKDGDLSKKPPKEIQEKVDNALKDPATFEFLISKSRASPEIIAMQEDAAEKMNKIRLKYREFKDNDFRRRVYTVQCIVDFIVSELAEQLKERGLSPDFIKIHEMSKEDFEKEILERVPTGLVMISLLIHRDLQFDRPITKNDISDVWSLSLAIPYCDIVVTDKEMASFALNSHLDKKCHTKILNSIYDLEEFL